MSAMGLKIDQFDVPVCNSFQAKRLNDQLCYEVDLNRFANNNIEKDLDLGFVFVMDYNEDRQVTFKGAEKANDSFTLVNKIDKSDENQHAFIYLDTIGMLF